MAAPIFPTLPVPSTDPPEVLALIGISKRFGATEALREATLLVRPRSIHALLGENGAGKSTLVNVAFGLLRPDAGKIVVQGVAHHFHSAADAIAAGLGMVHQHYMLVPAMTVAENVALGAARGGGGAMLDLRAVGRSIEEIGRATGLRVDPHAVVRGLGVAEQQRVEIVKALVHGARVLMLDEPTAVLAPAESRDLLAWLREYAQEGNAVVLITHKLREALAHADVVTVLRHGTTLYTAAVRDTDERILVAAMLGAGDLAVENRSAAVPTVSSAALSPPASARAVLALDGVSWVDEHGALRLRDVSLAIHAGEIVGVAGVEGAGQRELLRILAGRLTATRGSVLLPDAVAFVPEDRQRDALVLEMRISENVALRDAGSRRGVIPWDREEARSRELLQRANIRSGGPRTAAAALSGGNQQRLVLARELDGAPAALVAESPTRGLDVRAGALVLERLRAERQRGAAVVIYSADLDELLGLADRVLVVHGGRVAQVSLTREAIGRAMLGAA